MNGVEGEGSGQRAAGSLEISAGYAETPAPGALLNFCFTTLAAIDTRRLTSLENFGDGGEPRPREQFREPVARDLEGVGGGGLAIPFDCSLAISRR